MPNPSLKPSANVTGLKGELMSHLNLSSLGFLMIGLVATGIIGWFTLRRIADFTERSNAYRWLVAFGLSICTFMSAMPQLGQNQLWILLLPFAGTWLSLDSLHRSGEVAMHRDAKMVSSETKIA
jgi:hypothetical protein